MRLDPRAYLTITGSRNAKAAAEIRFGSVAASFDGD